MTKRHQQQAKKRVAKRYALRHKEIYSLAAIAAVVLGILVVA